MFHPYRASISKGRHPSAMENRKSQIFEDDDENDHLPSNKKTLAFGSEKRTIPQNSAV